MNAAWTGVGVGLSGLLLLAVLAGSAVLPGPTNAAVSHPALAAADVSLPRLVLNGWSIWREAAQLKRAKEEHSTASTPDAGARPKPRMPAPTRCVYLLDPERRKEYEGGFETKSAKLVKLSPN